jgi:glycosyltransferase involved in cell wall biosynthesis
VSKALELHFAEKYGGKNLSYVPNGVCSGRPRPLAEMRKLGLAQHGYILSIGRLVPEKGYDTLIQAFRQVSTEKPLVIAGGASHSESYVAELHEAAAGLPVIFTDYVYGSALEELFTNAYLFVSASEIEGLPFTVLEAMSYGTCVLASDIDPHVEILAGSGFTFQTGSGADLAEKLQMLVDNPEMVQQQRDAVRQRVETTYSWEPVAQAMVEVYEQLLHDEGTE